MLLLSILIDNFSTIPTCCHALCPRPIFILKFIQVAIYYFERPSFSSNGKAGIINVLCYLTKFLSTIFGPFLSDLARKEKVYPIN